MRDGGSPGTAGGPGRGAFTRWLTVVLCVSAGCDDGASSEAGGETEAAVPVARDRAESPLVSNIRDSAGIRIVENARPPDDSRLPWRVGSEPSMSIGEFEGDEPTILHEADDAVMLPDRRVVVANRGTNEIRVYDAAGNHQTTWGGSGGGPGEFEALVGIARWPGDSIVALEAMRSPTGAAGLWGGTVFDLAGNLGRSFRIESGDGHGLEPRIVLASGEILGRGTSGGADDGYWRLEAAYSLVSREGVAGISFGTHPAREGFHGIYGGVMLQVARMPFSRGLHEAQWQDALVIATDDRYELRAYGVSDGALAGIVRREHSNRAPTRAEVVEALLGALIEAEQPEEIIEMFRPAYEEGPMVESFPAFRAVVADALGHLWVREYTPPDIERPAGLWTVFDPEGRVLGFVETPLELDVYEIGADYLLGRARDEIGIERVQVWELERTGAPSVIGLAPKPAGSPRIP